jgi:hypothetical protein
LRDVRSNVIDVALNAVHHLQERGWLEGRAGLLKGMRCGWMLILACWQLTSHLTQTG